MGRSWVISGVRVTVGAFGAAGCCAAAEPAARASAIPASLSDFLNMSSVLLGGNCERYDAKPVFPVFAHYEVWDGRSLWSSRVLSWPECCTRRSAQRATGERSAHPVRSHLSGIIASTTCVTGP